MSMAEMNKQTSDDREPMKAFAEMLWSQTVVDKISKMAHSELSKWLSTQWNALSEDKK